MMWNDDVSYSIRGASKKEEKRKRAEWERGRRRSRQSRRKGQYVVGRSLRKSRDEPGPERTAEGDGRCSSRQVRRREDKLAGLEHRGRLRHRQRHQQRRSRGCSL